LEFLLCTLTPEVQYRLVHRNHVIWRTKITKFWRNGNDSKQPSKIKFVFFLYLRLSASSKENDLPLCIYFWYQTDSGISIGVFVVYIDTGSSMPISPSKSCDLADENNKILTEWKWFETNVLNTSIYSAVSLASPYYNYL
jgi:hypothetical protein